MKLRTILGITKTTRAMEATTEFGADRAELERRYREARAAYIEASNALTRFGIRYDELIADVPDSIDLASYSGTEREPTKPRMVRADELDPER